MQKKKATGSALNKPRIFVFFLMLPLLMCLHLTVCDAMIITVDPGHSYPKPGAVSCSGVGEVYFNDALAERVASALHKAGHIVRLTR
ncbi:MAG: N-acetylmuramoyl-L-alanine amidase, partial [Dissulfurispiraceae bacterium]